MRSWWRTAGLALTALILLSEGLTLTSFARSPGGKMLLWKLGRRTGRLILGGRSGSLRLWRPTMRGLLGMRLSLLRLGGCGSVLGGRFGLLLVGMRLLGVWMTSRGQ